MKQNTFVRTSNVLAAEGEIARLLARPRFELVGLGLIHGDRGLGKSRYGKQLAYRNGYIYLRLDASETAKSFSQKLWKALRYHLGLPGAPGSSAGEAGWGGSPGQGEPDDYPAPHGSTNTLMNLCLAILGEPANKDTVIVLDEFDNALPDRILRESVRDIVDNSFATVVLIGMNQVKPKLEQRNPHFFDRCNFFCEFKPITLADAGLICRAAAEAPVDDKVVEYCYSLSHGNIRKLIKGLQFVEGKLKAHKGVKLTARELAAVDAAAGDGS